VEDFGVRMPVIGFIDFVALHIISILAVVKPVPEVQLSAC